MKHTQSICKAFIADIVPGSDRADAYGKSNSFGSLGFVVGPVIGGHVYELQNGFFYVCVLTFFLFIINFGKIF